MIGPDDQVLRTTFRPTSDAEIRRALVWRNPICHPSVMFRRQEIRQVGGYLGGLYAEDYDLWVRIARRPGPTFHNLEYAGISYRATGAEARGSVIAYSSQAGTQIQRFVMTGSLLWLLGALFSWIKALRFAAVNFRRTLIKLLVSEGHQVYVLAPDYKHEEMQSIRLFGATPIYYPLSRAVKPVIFGSIAAYLAG
eukprot:gene56188-75026_t